MTLLSIRVDRVFKTYIVRTSNGTVKEYNVVDHPTNGRSLLWVDNITDGTTSIR